MTARLPARWLAPLVATLLATTARSAESIDARAARLTQAFLGGWLAFHPEEATRLGDHARDDELPSFATASLALEAAEAEASEESLRALPIERLSPVRAIEVRVTLARAARTARELGRDRRPERDPGFALAALAVALETPIRGFYASPCARSASLRHRLRAVPEYLRAVRLALGLPSRVHTRAAIERTAELLALCRTTVPERLGLCRESAVQADLAEADSIATAALEDFRDWLRDDVLARSTEDIRYGVGAFEESVALVADRPVALDSLRARARAELAAMPRESTPWAPAAVAKISPDSAAALLDRVRAVAARARAFDIRGEDRIEIADFEPPGERPRLVTVGPWDARKTRARLDLGPRFATGVLAIDPLGSRSAVELTLAGEGNPGRALLVTRAAALPSRVRQAFGIEAVVDGWARYAEAEWSERIVDDPAQRAIRRAREREWLARTCAELMVWSEGASIDSAAAWLAAETGLAAADARRAVLEAAAAPRWTAATCAAWAFRDLRGDAERGAGASFNAVAFHEALLSQGAIPPAWSADAALREAARKRRP